MNHLDQPGSRVSLLTQANTGLPGPAAGVSIRRQLFVMTAITLIYATCFVVIKAGLTFAPPLSFGGLRALIAGIALLVLVVIWRKPLIPARRSWPWLVVLALTATTLTFGGMFLSPGRTGAGIASVLGNTQALFTLLLAGFFLGEPLTRVKIAALGLGLIGIGLITGPVLLSSDFFGFIGSVTALASSLGAAIGNVVIKRMHPENSLLAVTGWQLILGSLPLLALSALTEQQSTINWTWAFAGELVFLALAGTSLTTALWYWLIQRAEVGRLSLFFFLVPVFGLGLAFVFFGESLSWLEVGGISVIISGLGISMLGSNKKVK